MPLSANVGGGAGSSCCRSPERWIRSPTAGREAEVTISRGEPPRGTSRRESCRGRGRWRAAVGAR
jgi:hypothetical protein